ITTLLRGAARREPLVLILDDLHDADLSSLLLLRFVSREIRDDPILVVGTFRDREVSTAENVSAMLQKIARDGSTLTPRGLGDDDVRQLIAPSHDKLATEPVIAALRRVTDGNPFFVKEVLRAFVARGGLESPDDVEAGTLEIPASVRELIRQRL